MDSKDKECLIRRYTDRFRQFGVDPRTLGWAQDERQSVRYNNTFELIKDKPNSTLLDVGCGFCGLPLFLRKKGWSGKYYGIDINPDFVEASKKITGEQNIAVCEIDNLPNDWDSNFDFVAAHGLFNTRLPSGQNINFINDSLGKMMKVSKIGLIADFLSPLVDSIKSDSYHTYFTDILSIVQTLTSRFILRHDYMPFEFSVILLRNDRFFGNYIFET